MPVTTPTLLEKGTSTANATSYATASFARTAGDALVLVVISTGGGATGVTDSGETWSNDGGAGFINIFHTTALASATQSLTIALDGVPTGCMWFVYKLNGAAAIKLSDPIADGSGTGTAADCNNQSLTIASSANLILSAVINNHSNAGDNIAPGTDYLQLDEQDYDTPRTHGCVMWMTGTSTAPTATIANSSDWAMVALEFLGGITDLSPGANTFSTPGTYYVRFPSNGTAATEAWGPDYVLFEGAYAKDNSESVLAGAVWQINVSADSSESNSSAILDAGVGSIFTDADSAEVDANGTAASSSGDVTYDGDDPSKPENPGSPPDGCVVITFTPTAAGTKLTGKFGGKLVGKVA